MSRRKAFTEEELAAIPPTERERRLWLVRERVEDGETFTAASIAEEFGITTRHGYEYAHELDDRHDHFTYSFDTPINMDSEKTLRLKPRVRHHYVDE